MRPAAMGLERVLVVTPWFPHFPGDRPGNFVFDSAEALTQRGLDVSILIVSPGMPRWVRWLKPNRSRRPFFPERFVGFRKIKLIRYPSFPRGRLWRLSELFKRRIARNAIVEMLRETGAQIIHAHTEALANVAVDAGERYGVPNVVTLHGGGESVWSLGRRRYWRNIAEGLRRTDRVVLVGETLRPIFASLTGTDRNFSVVPNGAKFSGAPVRPRFADPTGRIRFVSVSALYDTKGIDIALKALAAARECGFDNWEYTIAGDGVDRVRLERLSRELGLSDNVVFLGRVQHQRVFPLLENADVFLLPSYREAFGIAYVEAMAAGVLAVAVRGQGPEAYITHDQTGLLVESRSITSVTDCLLAIAADHPAMRRIALDGAAHARAGLSMERHAEALCRVFEEVMRNHRAPAEIVGREQRYAIVRKGRQF